MANHQKVNRAVSYPAQSQTKPRQEICGRSGVNLHPTLGFKISQTRLGACPRISGPPIRACGQAYRYGCLGSPFQGEANLKKSEERNNQEYLSPNTIPYKPSSTMSVRLTDVISEHNTYQCSSYVVKSFSKLQDQSVGGKFSTLRSTKGKASIIYSFSVTPSVPICST